MKYEETLLGSELDEIQGIVNELEKKYDSVESEEFAEECTLQASRLPYRIRKILFDFRNQKIPMGFLLLKGYHIDDEKISDTPKHWDTPWENSATLQEEIFQCLICSGLGNLFGWLTQENGRFLRNIVPIKADQDEQLGGSSRVPLLWHIEEAFHPQRADMMTIMCYRNLEKAGTNICSLDQMDIPEEILSILSQPRFVIEPDKSHFPENNQSQQWKLETDHFKRIKSFLANPVPTPVIFGPPGFQRMVVDQAFMSAVLGDLEAQEALDWFYQHLDERKTTIEMEPGNILLLDNRKVVHGRTPYKPNYGPKARWLRRGNITSDLTKSYEWKTKPHARTIL
jgi:Fe(II)/alpha-ketoglutarate-dependent arginine beta-hydroxylase